MTPEFIALRNCSALHPTGDGADTSRSDLNIAVGDGRGEGEVGIGGGAGDSAFDAVTGARAHDTEADGAVVAASGDSCWGPGEIFERLPELMIGA